MRRIARLRNEAILATDHPAFHDYLGDTGEFMRRVLNQNSRIVIEGSKGYGLSLLHGGYYPKATTRDTTAASFLGEAGLSPRDVDDVTLVLRCHPIRVAGDSGPLKGETTWREIAKNAGLPKNYCELTTATKKVRRVGTFDPELVREATTILHYWGGFPGGRARSSSINLRSSEVVVCKFRRSPFVSSSSLRSPS
jgi:adenylosuccinate synthase